MKIKAPKAKGNYSDRFNDCQLAIEDGLIDLLGAASVAGWSQQEVLTAIIEVADNTALALDARGKTDVEIRLHNLIKKKRPNVRDT